MAEVNVGHIDLCQVAGVILYGRWHSVARFP